ncbi:MAG: leucine-rich repeat protein [Bacilli bacterium]|nr:leucine-rich repeat protein [Bacilli bacterium]
MEEVNLVLYNKNFEQECIIDTFNSLIWTTRYQKPGDFEIYISPYTELFKKAKLDYYIYNKNSEQMMIIENIKTEIDVEKGTFATISGRSLESILDRRIIWDTTWYAGSIVDCIKLLIDKNIIDPSYSKRQIQNFEWGGVLGTDYQISQITKLGIDFQSKGENLLTAIQNISKEYNIGFKIICDINDNFKFKLYLYTGYDRSANNIEGNIVVEFSPNNDNLQESNFIEKNEKYKNVTLIGGEGDSDKRQYEELYSDKYEGLDRREIFTDASSINRSLDGHILSLAEYKRQLKEKGKENLNNNELEEVFDGKVLANSAMMFEYGKDFFIGDIVSLRNEFDKTGTSIITEIVESYDSKGYLFTPAFTKIDIEPLTIEGVVKTTSEGQIFTISGLENRNLTIIWGDGETSVSTEETASHIYQNEGSYDFEIKYTNGADIDFCPNFYNNNLLEKIEIPNGVIIIPENAFRGCTALAEITLPSSVTTLSGTNAFDGCIGLYTIVLPNSITSIGSYCFSGCSNLVSVNFPYSTETVPSYYLNGCIKVKSMKFPGNTLANKGVKTVSAYAMNGCTKLQTLEFGSLVTKIDGSCTNGTTKSLNITCFSYIPPTLTSTFDSSNEEKVSSIIVPTSPNYDDSVLNAYGNATNWRTYGTGDNGKIKEKDSGEEE